MCAILGGNEIDWDYESGIQSMKHRGPDGFRVVRDNNFTLAFARLAIMDLSKNGMQPMKSKDGLVTIVYNGEIYGYTSLKQDLEKKYEFFSFSVIFFHSRSCLKSAAGPMRFHGRLSHGCTWQ